MSDRVEDALVRAEEAVAEGRGLKGTGFWRAVDAVRRDRALAERHADRIAAIDRSAFENGVRLRVPAPIGLIALAFGLALGVAALFVTVRRDSGIALVIGFGAVLVCSHSLTHWLVGMLLGMRFTHVFFGGPKPQRPGVKTDYSSYLLASPRRRALMHASGAVVTKLIPFLMIPVVRATESLGGAVWVFLAIGVGQIFTDAVLSTKTSDWKKVKRELRAAGSS